jgi:hypothetical protein
MNRAWKKLESLAPPGTELMFGRNVDGTYWADASKTNHQDEDGKWVGGFSLNIDLMKTPVEAMDALIAKLLKYVLDNQQ